MALPLSERGHNVHMIAQQVPEFAQYYETFTLCEGVNNYLGAIDNLSHRADVFHVHNEPSWFVTAIKERCSVPVILDVHDSFAARMTDAEEAEKREKGEKAYRISVEERNNFQLADALVFPGEAFGKVVMDEYGLDQPHLILPSYLPRQFCQYNGREWMGGVVYQGRVDLKKDIEVNPSMTGFRYCDYEELATAFHNDGVDFHLYTPQSGKESFQKIYQDISYLHGGKAFSNLLPAIARHDWGLVGNIFHTPEWEVAMPNKLFDYIAANVPVVSINAGACSKFLEETGVGITVESVDELKLRWKEHRECRKRLIKQRQAWVMERHIHKLEELYNACS